MSLLINALNINVSNSFQSWPNSLEDILNKTEDIYSLETLQSVLDQRIAGGLQFYLAAIEENNHLFYLEASGLVEQLLKKNFRNPFTNNNIDNLSVYLYNSEKKVFEFAADKDQLLNNPLVYLEILYNNHQNNLEDRLKYLRMMGLLSMKNGDTERGREYLSQAAEQGQASSQRTLAFFFIKEKMDAQGVYWLEKYLEKYPNSETELFILGTLIESQNPPRAYSLYEKAASFGNLLAIVNVIHCYEKGIGTERDLEKASHWRQSLPPKHQHDSIEHLISVFGKNLYSK